MDRYFDPENYNEHEFFLEPGEYNVTTELTYTYGLRFGIMTTITLDNGEEFEAFNTVDEGCHLKVTFKNANYIVKHLHPYNLRHSIYVGMIWLGLLIGIAYLILSFVLDIKRSFSYDRFIFSLMPLAGGFMVYHLRNLKQGFDIVIGIIFTLLSLFMMACPVLILLTN